MLVVMLSTHKISIMVARYRCNVSDPTVIHIYNHRTIILNLCQLKMQIIRQLLHLLRKLRLTPKTTQIIRQRRNILRPNFSQSDGTLN
jgi:hypothetical protein